MVGLNRFLLVSVLCLSFANFISSLSVYNDKRLTSAFTLDSHDQSFLTNSERILSRHERDADVRENVTIKINKLNDTHQQLIVHWVGEESSSNANIIICLARNPKETVSIRGNVPSAVYYSYDYGDTYQNKTESFKVKDKYAQLDKFYIHPKFPSHTLFVDSTNKALFITEDHGKTFRVANLEFTPNEISFHPSSSRIILAHDKANFTKVLWLTEDFGRTWTPFQSYIKAFDWFSVNGTDEKQLVIQREEPDGTTTILSLHSWNTMNFDKYLMSSLINGVTDFYTKGDFIFATKNVSKSHQDLYVKYKGSKFVKAKFGTYMTSRDYHVADITENRIFIAVAHSETLSDLYISDIVNETSSEIYFQKSLAGIFLHIPNVTWKGSLISGLSDVAFVDLHKVEGMRGIYIASQVNQSVASNAVTPEHLITKITFDWGSEWRMLNLTKQLTGIPCKQEEGCSLHLSQKFALWYPNTRYTPILSTKSAPGLIMATGVLGPSLKGNPSVFVSRDAGLTWKQVLRDNYYFNIGDHGGILVAIKFYKIKDVVDEILYSTDEGEIWQSYKLIGTGTPIKVYSLMTQPGENTTVFSLFGSGLGLHQWIIVKADFKNVFSHNCTDDDYKTWSPRNPSSNKMNCLLGRHEVYQRRIARSNCFNGLNIDRPVKMEICPCEQSDFTCDIGFNWDTNTLHCVRNKSSDYNPYAVPKVCPPYTYFNRTKGYRKIAGDYCEGGTSRDYMPDLIPCPISEKKEFLLLAQKDRIVTFSLKDPVPEPLPIHGLENVIAVEFDLQNNCVFYADIVTDVISRWCLSNGSVAEKLVETKLQSVEGMAFDWISKHLYFVDGVQAKIEVIRTDIKDGSRFRKTVINSTVAKKPRGIAVHPIAGYMFWTDWAAGSPSINRANLDGSDIMKLFGDPVVEWPNGITIDYIAERVYWVDAKKDYIASCDLGGNGFKKIMEKNDKVAHPFSVAVFKDNMYWDDWKQNSIYVADKDAGLAIGLIADQLSGLMDLKIFAHSIQEGTNKCSNTTVCSHLCFGLPNNKFSCQCPDELSLVDSKKCVCPGGKEPLKNEVCLPVENTCSPGYFKCANDRCIPAMLHCDSDDDCGDNSDELNCNSTVTCPPSMFRCGNGKCIPSYWKCDNDYDCSDKSDEKDCNYSSCKTGQFSCDSGRCISKKWFCDGEDDCRDGSDERNCTIATTTCAADEHQCGGNGTCIPKTWQCDVEKDCPDGSDEHNCTGNKCEPWQFTCGNKKCIFKTWHCDGDNDCGDGSDEVNCTETSTETEFGPAEFPSGMCQNWMFQCTNKKCIPYWWKCDRVNDCGDFSDEVSCFTNETKTNRTGSGTAKPPPSGTCGDHEFRCSSGECIMDSWICDGLKDCPGGDDEKNCNNTVSSCPHDYFRCRKSGICIPVKQVCDGKKQCPDGSDEGLCNATVKPTPTLDCNSGHFACDLNHCLPLHKRCDGPVDCYDGSDEEPCTGAANYRTFQATELRVVKNTDTAFYVSWSVMPSYEKELDYLPSIQKNNVWFNETWFNGTLYRFDKLSAYTSYNVTVYVRNNTTKKIFPPAVYLKAVTAEGAPSPPINVRVVMLNISVIEVSWSKPKHPNGELQAYTVYVLPPVPAISLSVNALRTNTTLHYDFQADTQYMVTVTANNRLYESAHSDVIPFQYKNEEMIRGVTNLKVDKKTENSVTLSWTRTNESNVYRIANKAKLPYPVVKPIVTKEVPYTVTNLSPGVEYTFEVSPISDGVTGNPATVTSQTEGSQLPTVTNIKVGTIRNAVNISWDPPKDKRKLAWKYAIYYGITMQEVFQEPRIITENLNYTIPDLNLCTSYTFSVGVVLQSSYGPLSSKFVSTVTQPDLTAAPLNLKVQPDPANETNLIITWNSSCPKMTKAVGYIVKITDTNDKQVFQMKIPESRNSSFKETFPSKYGGYYTFVVSTENDSSLSETVHYYTPSYPPPNQVIAYHSKAGYVVTWDVIGNSPALKSLKYKFEVLVSEGYELVQDKSKSYFTEKPPVLISDLKERNVYSFAVRILGESGHKSPLSEVYTVENIFYNEPFEQSKTTDSSGSNYAWLVILLLVMVGGSAAFMYWKNKRSHVSFKNLANSHYNTRSGSTTFTGVNGLDLEDNTEIREHFSDDEPLVIA